MPLMMPWPCRARLPSLRSGLPTQTFRSAASVRTWRTEGSTSPKRGGETGYVGAGLSPGDGYYDEPYFYISAHPRPDPATLPKLPALGHWHTHEFTAAVAPAHKILARENREAATDDFLKQAVDYGIKILK